MMDKEPSIEGFKLPVCTHVLYLQSSPFVDRFKNKKLTTKEEDCYVIFLSLQRVFQLLRVAQALTNLHIFHQM